ncbi:YfdX family protein [Leptolyngbya sp. 7M]|nr:YfdX family protein [Leptolyngbya sp. 7M]
MKYSSHIWKTLKALLLGVLSACLFFITSGQLSTFAASSPESTQLTETLQQLKLPVQESSLPEDVEKEKQVATGEAERSLDQDAIAAIEETRKAIEAIDQGKTSDALQALERATGKLDILLARYPELGLVPVSTQVAVIDVAPLDKNVIERIRNQIKSAINAEDYPAARELLNNLMSEIRTTTLNLPLASYPDAMKQAARLLNDGQMEEAKAVLQTALSTLVMTEQARPLPLIEVHTKLVGAVAVADMDLSDSDGTKERDARKGQTNLLVWSIRRDRTAPPCTGRITRDPHAPLDMPGKELRIWHRRQAH